MVHRSFDRTTPNSGDDSGLVVFTVSRSWLSWPISR